MGIPNDILGYRDKVLNGGSVGRRDAKALLSVRRDNLYNLFCASNEIRKKFLGDKVKLCAIANARSGACSEDCAFCSQSSWHRTKVPVYPLLGIDEVYTRAKQAKQMQAGYFCIVTSGRRISSKEDFMKICKMITKIRKNLKLNVDASLGELSFDQAKALKEAGLTRYNHNLETAKTLYSKICTTHTFGDRLKTIDNIKKARLELCCGGIFGMGESQGQRLELLFSLKELSPECIPINFLNPIPGTRLSRQRPLSPLEFLKIVAVCRFLFPKKEIKICGGREANLRSLQPFLFLAGANSIIIGDYLTTSGNPPQYDLQMIKDLGLVCS